MVDYKKRGRNHTGCGQSAPFIGSIAFQKVAFCDASIVLDGFNPVSGTVAAWSVETTAFEVRDVFFSEEEGKDLGKARGVDFLELSAILLGAEIFPDHKLYSDSKVAICLAKKLGLASAEWMPRELNGIANLLAKSKLAGSGSVVFNESTPRRGWIYFDYERFAING